MTTGRFTQQRRAKIGKQAESIAEGVFLLSRMVGIAFLYSIPNSWVIVGKTTMGAVVKPKEKTGPDWVGHLANGRAVLVEVKSALGENKAWDFKSLKPHQKQALKQCHLAGGVAMVFVVGRDGCYAVPWPKVEEVTSEAKQIALSKLREFKLKRGEVFLKKELAEVWPNPDNVLGYRKGVYGKIEACESGGTVAFQLAWFA